MGEKSLLLPVCWLLRFFFLYCVGGLSLRENQTLLSSSQLLVPCLFPLFVLIHFKFQLVGCDHAVFISVLVLEHVGDDLLHGQPGLYATFALCHLQLDELRKLKLQRSRTISHKLVSDHRSLACSNAKEKPLFHYVKTISNMNNNYLKLQFFKKSALFLVSPPDGSKVSWVHFRESSFIVKKNHDFTRKKNLTKYKNQYFDT